MTPPSSSRRRGALTLLALGLTAVLAACGGESTDRRFDLRLFAFDINPADLPARHAAGAWLALQSSTVLTTGNQWQQATAGFVLPAATRYVLVEIAAFEDMFNNVEGPEFAGHYADDISLALTRMPRRQAAKSQCAWRRAVH